MTNDKKKQSIYYRKWYLKNREKEIERVRVYRQKKNALKPPKIKKEKPVKVPKVKKIKRFNFKFKKIKVTWKDRYEYKKELRLMEENRFIFKKEDTFEDYIKNILKENDRN